jgi:hypothetical protein
MKWSAAKWQRCAVHFYRNVFTVVPCGQLKEVAAMQNAIHGPGGHGVGAIEGVQVAEKLEPNRRKPNQGLILPAHKSISNPMPKSWVSQGLKDCVITRARLRLFDSSVLHFPGPTVPIEHNVILTAK